MLKLNGTHFFYCLQVFFFHCLQVVPGSHQYRFIVDGQWRHDNKKPKVENDVGSHNNIMTVFKGATSTEISSSCLKMRKKPVEKSGGVEVPEKGGVTNGEKEEVTHQPQCSFILYNTVINDF